MRDLNVQTLVKRCINGERLSWDKFVERYSRLIYWAIRKALKRTNYQHSQQDLEDIFQNVFILLWKDGKLKQVRDREKISGWLAMVAANCARNFFRNKTIELKEEEFTPEKIATSDFSSSQLFGQERRYQLLEGALAALLPRERVILKLCFFHEKTHNEIGRILRMPANTVSSIIKRAKESLRERLRKGGFEVF